MTGLRKWAPGVPDIVFGIVLAMVLAGGRTGLLNDPGTSWHLRLGREIVETGTVPRSDTLTYTRAQTPWVDQSWAFDLLLAELVDRGGWSAAIAVSAIALALVYGWLARGLLAEGVSAPMALLVALIAAGIGSIHFLIRPHLFTMVFVLWTLRACQAQHERGGWHVMIVPLLMTVWANVHGGFLAGPVIVATALGGHAIAGPWDRQRQRNVLVFGSALVLSCLTPLINPYGLGLYRHVGHLLVTSGVTELIDEYQPLPFGQAKARVAEMVVLALIALPTFGKARISRYDLLHALVWLHLALGSTRHAPLFALAVAPALAKLMDGLPVDFQEMNALRIRWTAWPIVAAVALGAIVIGGGRLGGFDPEKWPLEAVPALNQQPADLRLFHEQDWGGLIEAECGPGRRAFVDDRFELFGKAAILEYVEALQGGPGWDALLGREKIGLVWVRPDRPLAKRLAADGRWRVVHRDQVSVLFRRDEGGGTVGLRAGN